VAVDVLVTGAAGVLGREIVKTLRSANYQVMACGRVPADGMDARWDVSRQDAPEPDCSPGAVIHAAAKIGGYQHPLSDAKTLFDVNVTGTLRVARWCASRKVEHLTLVSGAIVYGEWSRCPKSEEDPVNPWMAGSYAVSKYCGEQAASLVRGSGTSLTVLRLSSLYGVGYANGLAQRLINLGLETGSICINPPVEDAFDLLHVSDGARAIQRAMEHKQVGLWNVGSGTLTTIQGLAEACARQIGVQVTIADSVYSRPTRIINWVDDTKARRDLNHANRASLDSGIAEIVQSLR